MGGAMLASTAGMAVLGGYSSYQSAKQQNRMIDAQNRASIENQEQVTKEALRRYALESNIADMQYQEQMGIALEGMTDISRAFLLAKGQEKVAQAESGVTGVTRERILANMKTKEQDAKGRFAKEIDTNMINIANAMLSNKIDTDAVIAKSKAQINNNYSNVFGQTLLGGIQGGIQGFQLGSAIQSSFGTTASQTTKGIGNGADYMSKASSQYSTYYGSEQNRMLADQMKGF